VRMEEDPRRKLAYEESVRALQTQSGALDDLRSRTGILLTALSLTATFLGARALNDSGLCTLNWIALALFAVSGCGCLAILLPWGNWHFVHNAKSILDQFVAKDASLDAMHTEMAEANQSRWSENADNLSRLQWAFRAAVVFLVLQVACWLISLGH
jgi:hypothetical protein